MKKLFNKKEQGFTLVELIVVIAIIGVLAVIVVPNFVGLTQKAKDGTVIANASVIAGAVNVYNALNPEDAITTLDPDSIGKINTAELWPTGLEASSTNENTKAAIEKIEFNNGVATVNVNNVEIIEDDESEDGK